MAAVKPVFRKIAIVSHPRLPEAQQEAPQLASFLADNGIDVEFSLLQDEELRNQLASRQVDLVIALGGDGTMLRAGHLCGPVDVPILGINLGRFGFLAEIQKNQWAELLPRLLSGEFWLEKRMMLTAKQVRDGATLGTWDVLNEIVVCRGSLVRPVRLTAAVDGRYLTTYVADALIASTATGSTAYALAAGGPILPPELRNILLVAVAPHLSLDRAIVLSEGSSVTITVHSDHQAVLSPDGQHPVEMQDGDQVEACASQHSVQFVRFQDPAYFYRNLTIHMNQNPSIGNLR
jgi:NAD+ kinase